MSDDFRVVKGAMRRLTLVALLLLLGMLAASCQRDSQETPEPTPSPSPDLRQEKFELTGTVTEVELGSASDTPVSPTPSPSPSPGASPVPGAGESPVRLSVEIDTINDPARDLCGVGPGDTVTLVISSATNIDPKKALSELDDLDSQKISAGGTATLQLGADEADEEREGGTTRTATPGPGSTPTATTTVDAGGDCFFDTESLRVVQGEPREDSSPGRRGSPTPTGSPSPGRTSLTPSPTS